MNNEGSINYGIPFSNKTTMTRQQVLLVQKTWKVFRDIKPEIIGDVFYSKLFIKMPALKKMFKAPMAGQSKKLIDMLNMIVGRLQNVDEIAQDIKQMAKRHVGYGVKAVHYEIVGEALLWTLEQGLGNDWNQAVEDAWVSCYKSLAGIMIEAAEY